MKSAVTYITIAHNSHICSILCVPLIYKDIYVVVFVVMVLQLLLLLLFILLSMPLVTGISNFLGNSYKTTTTSLSLYGSLVIPILLIT